MKTLGCIFSLCFILALPLQSFSKTLEYSSRNINPSTTEIMLHYILEPEEYLYKNSITMLIDHPSYKLSPYKSSKDASMRYDPTFKKSKKVFENEITLSIQVTAPEKIQEPAYLHVSTATNKQGTDEVVIPITAPSKNDEHLTNKTVQQEDPKEIPIPAQRKNSSSPSKSSFSLSEYISNLVKTINSPLMRIILVYILGMLLSLTPCIYPMVPITIGILQAQGSKSLFYNFLSALSYTCGIATTFALFGLLASCTGPLCGQLLLNHYSLYGLVILLIYLGFSMLGLYDVYVPKFFKPSTKNLKGGSLLYTFIFGAASGTIASPCVSPWISALVSIVATLNNKFLVLSYYLSLGLALVRPY